VWVRPSSDKCPFLDKTLIDFTIFVLVLMGSFASCDPRFGSIDIIVAHTCPIIASEPKKYTNMMAVPGTCP
jgi:hypothetical protein